MVALSPMPALVLLVADEKLSEQAKNNSIGNFKFGFEDMFQNKLIERMDSNQDIFQKSWMTSPLVML